MSDERPLIRRLRKAGVDPDAGLSISTRKPEWLRIEAHMGSEYQSLKKLTEDLRLVTVCEEAGCPNIFECWASGTATFMVNGERCTRACGFCLVDTRKPLALDPTEPDRVAEAVVRLKLAHAVITCVARDDLADGGAGAIAASVRAIRERSPNTDVEVLISDLRGDPDSLRIIIDERPDVLNHNVETVARLQRAVRPSAGYLRSLTVLARGAEAGLSLSPDSWSDWARVLTKSKRRWRTWPRWACRSSRLVSTFAPPNATPVARYWEPGSSTISPIAVDASVFATCSPRPSLVRATTPAKRSVKRRPWPRQCCDARRAGRLQASRRA